MAAPETPFKIHMLLGFGALPKELASLQEPWGRAAAYVAKLPPAAITPAVKELPAELAGPRAALLASQGFKDLFGDAPADVKMINLEQVIVFQRHLILNHVADLARHLTGVTDLGGLFRYCMYPPGPPPARGEFDRSRMTCTLASDGFEYTVVDVQSLPAHDLRLLGPAGPPLKEYATNHLLISFGLPPNYLSACLVEDRLLLRNGSHRAYALFRAGRKEVPCVVQPIANRAALAGLGFSSEWAAVCLDAPRPPLLRDYFDEDLFVTLARPPYKRILQVQMTSELRPLSEPGTKVYWRT